MSSAPRFTRALLAVSAIAVLAACGTARPSASAGAQPSLSPEDVDAASKAALTLFVQVAPNAWVPCPSTDRYAACPLAPAVKDRLTALVSANYFYSGPGGHCAGDFISNSTNGLQQAPRVVSAVAGANGNVTVVIERANTTIPNLTGVMARQDGKWVAVDLASGSGPNASIFATNPNC